MNTEILQDYATRKGLALPKDLDLIISGYSDSDIFSGDTDDEEEAGPDMVADQGASEESSRRTSDSEDWDSIATMAHQPHTQQI
ncbi:hypothetical protein FANTH_3923 [Fusarium anthophilum]|uniref:Uncharacterized protein n=1 Tax=Fusarium anthophilum TaxID=48485 RepID=A0A8H4ZQJ9_9HYPO|nr:hypothetical protein FANTH_3923 [Fusarium anthophilum]